MILSRSYSLKTFSLGFLVLFPSFSLAYDQVNVAKVVPLVSKKLSPDIIRVSPSGDLWVLDRDAASLQQVSDKGTVSFLLNPGKKKDALYISPVDFTFTKDEKIAVSDSSLKRIVFIDLSSEKPVFASAFAVENPGALAISHDDIVAVAKENSIQVYSLDGVLLHFLFPGSGQEFKSITAMTYANDGTLWVLDSSAGKVHRFSAERKWLGVTDGFDEAKALTVDSYGFAYVTLAQGRWKEVSPEGKVAGTFGAKGKTPGQMLNPTGAALLSDDLLWVADRGNNRFELFKITNSDKKAPLTLSPAARIQVRRENNFVLPMKSAMFDEQGNILVMDEKTHLHWYSQEGKRQSSWDKKSKTIPLVKEPAGFAMDLAGQIWVTDQSDHTIKLVSREGEVKKTIGQKGKKEGNLSSPSFLHVRKDSSFIVVDRSDSRVQVLSKDGLFLFALGTAKDKLKFEKIVGIAGNDDGFAVLDAGKKTLMFFDQNGKYISEVINKEGASPVWKDPSSVVTDSFGDYFVLDAGSGRIRVFDPKGKYLADFFAAGNLLACGPKNKILVASEKENRLYEAHIVPRVTTEVALVDDGGFLKLSWMANLHATSYNVYRSSGQNPFILFASTSTTSLIDMKVVPGVSYRYGVAGVNAMGAEGNWSISNALKAPKRSDVSLVSISSAVFNPIFTAAFKYYVDNPIGSITLLNNSDHPYRNVKVSIFLKNYTDFATEKVIELIGAGESIVVPVTLTLNDHVIEINENTPVQADVRVSYFEDNKETSASQNAPLMLYSRYSISWADKERIASFVTPKDPPITEFSRSAIKNFLAPLKSATVGKPLAKAALLYESLNALKMSYVPDPKTPFAEVSTKPDAIDYVQFPRETLRRRTGDCDDTTALLASLLASIGVDVALVDIPGHIFLMADTEESDEWVLGLPKERFVEYKGTYWIPIETTRLGKGFLDAWQAGANEIKSAKDQSKVSIVPLLKAQEKYPPVSILEKEENPVAYPTDIVKAAFPKVLDDLQKERYQFQLAVINEKIKANPDDQMLKATLAMVHFEGQHPEEAKKIFEGLLQSKDPEVVASAQNNLGNLSMLSEDYKAADGHYAASALLDTSDGGIIINRARCAWKLGDNATAKKYLIDAAAVMPNWLEFVSDFPAELLPK